ncbi:MAG: gluconate 2-dehydrogenase subunit 3 family protein [Verrucomicrobiota bacterium]
MTTDRRNFLKAFSVSLAGAPFLLGQVRPSLGPYQVLTDLEAETIIALCEQLIPEDEFGGATDAGVVYFFDKQLGPRGHYPDQLDYYRAELSVLNTSCEEQLGLRFAALKQVDQLSYLKTLEGGEVAHASWTSAMQRRFFRTLLDHTMQAYYGDPRHGGNKDYLSHFMMKI